MLNARWRAGRWAGRWMQWWSFLGWVTVSMEVGNVINHKVRVRGYGLSVLLHGGIQFENIVFQDGVLEHEC